MVDDHIPHSFWKSGGAQPFFLKSAGAIAPPAPPSVPSLMYSAQRAHLHARLDDLFLLLFAPAQRLKISDTPASQTITENIAISMKKYIVVCVIMLDNFGMLNGTDLVAMND